MTQFLRRGRLEVETDLLLGADDVLLPAGIVRSSASASENVATRTSESPASRGGSSVGGGNRGFEADLFAPSPRVTARPPQGHPQPSIEPRPAEHVEQTAVRAETAVTPIVDRIVPPAGPSKAARLAELERCHAAGCPHCTTASGHTSLVFGEGNPDAELVFVGEAPGEMEDRTGRPFVGPAGEKLNEMIGAMGLRREDVYIANVLKSRPPNNRTPLASEVERCGPYLLAQLAVIRPKAIVTLGGPATKLLLATELGITRLRGVSARVRLGEAEGAPFEVPVMPTFHPAYLLRNYTVETRGQVWSDLKQALAMIGREPPKRS